eukprot:1202153-Alexandrium_andersonii.AAC.1
MEPVSARYPLCLPTPVVPDLLGLLSRPSRPSAAAPCWAARGGSGLGASSCAAGRCRGSRGGTGCAGGCRPTLACAWDCWPRRSANIPFALAASPASLPPCT